MRLKLLFFPAIFVAVVVMLIWFIVPKYQEMVALKDRLEAVKADLQNVQQRQQTVTRLTSELNQNQVLDDFLSQYIPFAKDEEYVINAINNIATISEVDLVALNIGEMSSPLFSNDSSDDTKMPPTIIQADGSVLGTVTVPVEKLSEFTIEASIIGSYDVIKKFIAATNKINRLSIVAMASIEKVDTQNSIQDNPTAANDVEVSIDVADNPTLLGKFVLSFAYVSNVIIPRGADSPVFHREELGVQKITNIVAALEAPPILDLESGQRSNPFIDKQD